MTDAAYDPAEPDIETMSHEDLKSLYTATLNELREQDALANIPTADDVALAIVAGLCAQQADASNIAQTVQQAVALAWQIGVPQYMAERNNYIAALQGDQTGGV